MGSYYYLVAQLPSLSCGMPKPMSSSALLDLCIPLMKKDDSDLLAECVIDPRGPEASESSPWILPKPTNSPLIDGFRTWELGLRRHLALLRSQSLKRDTSAYAEPPFYPIEAAGIAKTAVAMDDPLEAEYYLDNARWNALDALQGFDYFGRDTVFAYLIKLLLLERKAEFNRDEGYAEYQRLYTAVMEAAPTSIQAGVSR